MLKTVQWKNPDKVLENLTRPDSVSIQWNTTGADSFILSVLDIEDHVLQSFEVSQVSNEK